MTRSGVIFARARLREKAGREKRNEQILVEIKTADEGRNEKSAKIYRLYFEIFNIGNFFILTSLVT